MLRDPSQFVFVRHSSKAGVTIHLCPRCDDRSGHVEVDGSSGLWFCHRCKAGGRLGGFKDSAGRSAPASPEVARTHDLNLAPCGDGSRQVEYLRDRGMDDGTISRLNPHSGPCAFGVYFPWDDYYTMRRISGGGDGPKWLFPRVQPGKSARVWTSSQPVRGSEVVLVEGLFDAAWSPRPTRVAILGSSLSPRQVAIVSAMRPSSVTAFCDGDAAGVRGGMLSLCALLSSYSCAAFLCECPPGTDPCDLGTRGDEFVFDTRQRIL